MLVKRCLTSLHENSSIATRLTRTLYVLCRTTSSYPHAHTTTEGRSSGVDIWITAPPPNPTRPSGAMMISQLWQLKLPTLKTVENCPTNGVHLKGQSREELQFGETTKISHCLKMSLPSKTIAGVKHQA